MKNYELIGLICAASVKNNIAMTTAEIIKIAEYLSEHRVGITPPCIAALDEFRKSSAKVEVEDEPAINNPVEELGISKKNQNKLRHATMDDIIKPKPVAKKPKNALTPREQQMWNYVQTHPGASMDATCRDMGIKMANYYLLRKQLLTKGYAVPNNKPQPVEKSDMDKRMEDAYMGEHMNIQPEPIPKKPVSEKAQKLYEYMQSHPDARMPSICEALGITNGEYYMLKVQLKKNGWIISAVENVKEVEL